MACVPVLARSTFRRGAQLALAGAPIPPLAHAPIDEAPISSGNPKESSARPSNRWLAHRSMRRLPRPSARSSLRWPAHRPTRRPPCPSTRSSRLGHLSADPRIDRQGTHLARRSGLVVGAAIFPFACTPIDEALTSPIGSDKSTRGHLCVGLRSGSSALEDWQGGRLIDGSSVHDQIVSTAIYPLA